MVSNYQLLVKLKLRRNPVASIDKLLVELKIAEKPRGVPIHQKKIKPEKPRGVLIY